MRNVPSLAILFALALATAAGAEESRPFAVQVVDEATGRGVPLVELETVNHLRFITDSHGLAAISEPDLMGQTVYFHIRSHGYEFPKDGFGFRGKALHVEPGGRADVKLRRLYIAQRLYRTTGSGIYRDSILLGEKVPLEKSLHNAAVFGCDSVMAAVYRGKIHWFWGDTVVPNYPLGNFHITGATSRLPADGGLDPDQGVNFDYFVGPDQRVRPMAEMPGEGPTWISAVTVLREAEGRERMYANYVKIRNQLEAYQWGFAVWNDETQRFDHVIHFDERPAMFPKSQTHSFHRREADGTEFIYFANPFPLTRVPADPAAFVDPERYEGFTCLKPGTRPEEGQLDRDADGRLRYAWKRNTPCLTHDDQARLIKSGALRSDEVLIALRDAETGRTVEPHNGSTYWNDYRQQWVMIATERGGESSTLGEIWYAEAAAPTGPWTTARKIVTHDNYTFYNPKHHPFLDKDGGRILYFEGTYTHTFSGNTNPTPRYDYNQIMYKLDLSAPPLNLPPAVSLRRKDAKGQRFAKEGEE